MVSEAETCVQRARDTLRRRQHDAALGALLQEKLRLAQAMPGQLRLAAALEAEAGQLRDARSQNQNNINDPTWTRQSR